ncbi:MAG: hypothetical protein QM709_04290 [Spongiibacteraceae bacterium]
MTLCRAMLVFAGFCLAACSHTPSASDIPPNVSFVTKILGDDTKLFTYTVHRGRGGPGGDEDMPEMQDMPSRGGMRGGPGRDEPSSKVMVRGAEAMLLQNHYCRDGFMVLEQYEQHRNYIIRGECRDAATSADREKFPPQ